MISKYYCSSTLANFHYVIYIGHVGVGLQNYTPPPQKKNNI
ncbi:MAG: hypothetical protein QXN01_03480 [Candidatus Anstonellales archaeon]